MFGGGFVVGLFKVKFGFSAVSVFRVGGGGGGYFICIFSIS